MQRLYAILWLVAASISFGTIATAQAQHYASEADSSNERLSTSTSQSSGQTHVLLTLQTAIDLSIKHNPRLAAAEFKSEAQQASVRQANLFPNPELSLDAENFGGSGSLSDGEFREFTLGISQLVELGGKRSKRNQVASAELEALLSSEESRKQDVIKATSVRFFRILANQERLLVSDSLLATANQFFESVQERRIAGKVSALVERRAKLQLTTAQLQRADAVKNLLISWNDLRSMWGGFPDSSTVAVGEFEQVVTVPSIESLTQRLDYHSEVVRSRNIVDLQHAVVALERSLAIPDPTVGFGARRIRELGETGAVASVSIPISLFNRNQGSIESARHEILVAEQMLRATQTDLFAQLQNLYADVMAARNEALVLDQRALVDALENMNATVAGYTDGKFDLLTVLDAQRVLLNISTRHIDALERFHLSRIELERLISVSFSNLSSEEADHE